MKYAEITDHQKDSLLGRSYDNNVSYFNPVQDINGKWFIGEKEVNDCVCAGVDFVHNLQLHVKPLSDWPVSED